MKVKPGEKVQFTITGKINKSGGKIEFKRSDAIKVISKKGTTKEAIDDVGKMTDKKVFSQFNPR
jgi:hypothetical protein